MPQHYASTYIFLCQKGFYTIGIILNCVYKEIIRNGRFTCARQIGCNYPANTLHKLHLVFPNCSVLTKSMKQYHGKTFTNRVIANCRTLISKLFSIFNFRRCKVTCVMSVFS